MSRWDGKSIGPAIGYKIFLLFIKVLGINFAYFILRFVAYYYFLTAKERANAIFKFYTTALNFSASKARRITRKNFYTFGQTLIDSAAFLIGQGKKISFSFTNEAYLRQMQQNGKGAILLSAHLGNYETAGNLLKGRISSKINVVMVDGEAEKIKKLLQDQTGGSHFTIIAVKNDLSHVIKIKNALDNNEMVAIHADRYTEGAKFMKADFFGREAKFPLGPFLIASKFNAPVSFVFTVKKGKFHYTLSSTEPITERLKPEEFLKRYIAELENKVKDNPEQWFNFFDFYE